jgi:thiopeptide-type bacteriocin biosynthesis protein
VQRWRIQHGLPVEVFAQLRHPQAVTEARQRKPVWVHFHSPYALEILEQLASQGADLTFTEVLPSRSGHWVSPSPNASERRASEFMAMARWPMPRPRIPAPIRPSVFTPGITHFPGGWLYLKIYPRMRSQMDQVIAQIVDPAIQRMQADSSLERWFFVRYIDERGWHIRLRLKGSEPSRRRWLCELSDLIDSTLPGLEDGDFIDRRLLPSMESSVARPSLPGFVQAHYEPEYEKYGGAVGLDIAEELFEASSDLTLGALRQLRAPNDYIILMLGVARSMICQSLQSETDRKHFLQHYLWYWTGQDGPGAANLRLRFRAASARRRAVLSERLGSLDNVPTVGGLIADFEGAIQAAVSKLRIARDHITESPSNLGFDYLHMTNNRLGVLPREEGYLASLLLEL